MIVILSFFLHERNTLNKYDSEDGELGLNFSLFGTSSLPQLQNFTDHFKSIPLYPVDTERKLNLHKTFRGRPGHLPNVLCTFNLRPVSTG